MALKGKSILMKRVGSLLLRGVIAVVGSALVSTASAQVDPLAPLPEQALERVSPPQPSQSLTPVRPQPTYVIPAARTGFDAYRQRLTYIARAGGIREQTIAAVVPYLRVNSRAIRLDRSGQPGAVGNTSYTP